jgi:hypothetical protein
MTSFLLSIPDGRTVALGWTRLVIEMSARDISGE